MRIQVRTPSANFVRQETFQRVGKLFITGDEDRIKRGIQCEMMNFNREVEKQTSTSYAYQKGLEILKKQKEILFGK